MEKPKVSVIIPCYNSAVYLAEAIESALRQTYRPHEIIVVDDGSTDGSAEIAARYPVMLIVLPDNHGHAVARNVALAEATGDWIAWLDSDDLWDSNHIELLLGVAASNPRAAVIASGWRFLGNRSGFSFPQIGDGFVDTFLPHAFVSTPFFASSVLTLKSAVQRIGGFNPSLYHAPDFDFWLRLSLRFSAAGLKRITSSYRWHDHNISKNGWDSQLRSMFIAREAFILSLQKQQMGYLADYLHSALGTVWLRHLQIALGSRSRRGLQTLGDLRYRYPCRDLLGVYVYFVAKMCPLKYWPRIADKISTVVRRRITMFYTEAAARHREQRSTLENVCNLSEK